MHKVKIEMVGLEPRKLFGEIAVHVGTGLHELLEQFGRELDFFPPSVCQRPAHEGLAEPLLSEYPGMVEPRRVHVIDAAVYRVMQQPGSGGFVDLIRRPQSREAHAAEPQCRDFDAGATQGSVLHKETPDEPG